MSDNARKNSSGIDLPIVADKTHLPDDLTDSLPGEYPYLRGVYPNMYSGRFWTMRQYAGFGTASETNQRFRYLLEKGQTGLSVAFDLATQIGYDSDHEMARGEVGRTGVAIDSLNDMELLFDQIPLDKVSTSMTINSTSIILLAMYIAVGKKQGVAPSQLMGTVQNDILKEFIARGTYIYPPEPSMRIITDIFAYANEHLPKYNTISISGYHIREAGSTAAQEVAFTLSDAIAYCEAAIATGLDIDKFAPRLSFFFAAHNDLFEEVAKFRAARTLWAGIVKNRFKAKNEKSMLLRFHTQTGGSTLTAQQPENNIVRTTVQAMSAVLGGTQSLHTNSFDEALGLPTEKSAEIALRTQQLLAHESGVATSADPLAGSYYVEYLTDKTREKAQKILDHIDRLGGAVACVQSGYYRDEIARAAYEHQKRIESEQIVVIGVNKFKSAATEIPEVLKVNPELEQQQIERLTKIKTERNNDRVKTRLDKLAEAARSDTNLVPLMVEAVEEYVTVGEIANLFRSIWGEHNETV